MAKPLRLGVAYDFRNPPESGLSHQSLYAAIMDQVAWSTGWGSISSGSPSISSSTTATCRRGFPSRRRWRRAPSAALLLRRLPAALQPSAPARRGPRGARQYQRRRVEIGVGMGYAPHEFRGFGLPVSRRVSLTDEGLEVLKRAFTGETFSYAGKRYKFRT